MSIVVVGTVAFDTIETPFGKGENVLGGSATYFSTSASFFPMFRWLLLWGRISPMSMLRFSRLAI